MKILIDRSYPSRIRIYEKWCPTVRNYGSGGNKMPLVLDIPMECERLMGLPDQWTEGVSDTQRYKLCGNGVVVNVVEEIIKRLI